MPRTAVERLCAAATAAALVPIWLFPWFPTQDGPSHLYNAFVLARYGDAASVVVRSYFQLNLRLFPNWMTYFVMAPLTRILPPLIVQQIVLSICVISIPAAVVYLQKSFKPAADPAALLGVLLAFSYVLFMGFFNFVIGAALLVVAMGFWWRMRNGRYLYGLYGLLIAIYLSHGLAFAAALLAISILAAVERRWRVFLELAPAFLLFAIDTFTRPLGQPLFRSFQWHVRQLVAFFAGGHIAIAAMTLVIVTIAIVAAFIRSQPNPVALISAVLFLAYFVAPWGYSGEGLQAGWINERLLFLTILTLPGWIVLPRPAVSMTLLTIAIAAHLGATTLQIARINGYIREITRCAALIRPHTTIQTFFPMANMNPQVTPTLHLTAYLGLQTDVVDLDDYEARLPDFPLAYRAHLPSRPPDYIVAWRRAQVPAMTGYEVIFENAAIRLLQRVPTPAASRHPLPQAGEGSRASALAPRSGERVARSAG
jgi:hypothetical protein